MILTKVGHIIIKSKTPKERTTQLPVIIKAHIKILISLKPINIRHINSTDRGIPWDNHAREFARGD